MKTQHNRLKSEYEYIPMTAKSTVLNEKEYKAHKRSNSKAVDHVAIEILHNLKEYSEKLSIDIEKEIDIKAISEKEIILKCEAVTFMKMRSTYRYTQNKQFYVKCYMDQTDHKYHYTSETLENDIFKALTATAYRSFTADNAIRTAFNECQKEIHANFTRLKLNTALYDQNGTNVTLQISKAITGTAQFSVEVAEMVAYLRTLERSKEYIGVFRSIWNGWTTEKAVRVIYGKRRSDKKYEYKRKMYFKRKAKVIEIAQTYITEKNFSIVENDNDNNITIKDGNAFEKYGKIHFTEALYSLYRLNHIENAVNVDPKTKTVNVGLVERTNKPILRVQI